MPTLSTQATFSGAEIMALVAALGLSSTAGLRACLTLFAVGLASDVSLTANGISFVSNGNGPHPLILLNGNFHVLGSYPVLIVMAILALAEFIVDKIPGLDHVNDIIHTIIRPVIGAVILAGTTNTLSDVNVWVAAVVGFLLAFAVHGAKSGARVAVTTTTGGIGNPVVSLGEDALTVGSIALLIFFPIVGLILAIIVVLIAWRLGAWLFGRRRPRTRQASQPPTQPLAATSAATAVTAVAPQPSGDYAIPFQPFPFLNSTPTGTIRTSRPIAATDYGVTQPADPMNAPTLPITRPH